MTSPKRSLNLYECELLPRYMFWPCVVEISVYLESATAVLRLAVVDCDCTCVEGLLSSARFNRVQYNSGFALLCLDDGVY